MTFRKVAFVAGALSLATACTALIGLEDLPPAPALPDAAPPVVVTPAEEAGPADAGAEDLAPAITEYVRAFCNRDRECVGPDFEYNYRNVEECVAANVVSLTWASRLPGTTATAKAYRDCATNVAALTCAQFSSRDADFTCALRGARKVNERCLASAQCETGFCGSDDTTCRGCVNPPDNGLPCAAGDQCGPGLVCNAKKLCVTQAKASEACSPDKPCVYPNGCDDGTCKPLPATAGAVCGAAGCDTTKGFLCVGGVCRPFTISGPGGACSGGGGTGPLPICRLSAPCSDAGVCGEISKEGDACDVTGPRCPWPLRCVNKKCTGLPASSQCE